MRYFLKHTLKTLASAPLLPLLVLLTVILSVAITVCAVCTEAMFASHMDDRIRAETALGDIVISVRGDNDVRMLFCEDAERIAGEGAEVLGEYSLNAFCTTAKDDSLWSVGAVDLARADAYFQFRYTDYGSFDTKNLDSSLIISETCALMHGLEVGDEVKILILNRECNYTVQAIAKPDGLLAERDALLSVSGVVRILAQQVPAIAVLGEEFTPYNRLMLRADDADAVFSRIGASEEFSARQLVRTQNDTQLSYILFWQYTVVRLLALIVLLLCGILIGTCLHQLRVRRAGEIALFCSIGASRKHLWLLQLTENTVYAVLGCVGGTLLSVPLVRLIGTLFIWNTEPLYPAPNAILLGCGFALLLMTGMSISPLFAKQTEVRIGEDSEPDAADVPKCPKNALFAAAGTVLCTVLCFALPPAHALIPGVLAALCTGWLLFSATPYLLRRLAAACVRLHERSTRPRPSAFLILRSLKNHPTATHASRLLAVLLAIMSTLTVCRQSAVEQIELLQNMFAADTVAVGLSDPLAARLEAHPAVDGIMRVRYVPDAELNGKQSTLAIAASGELEDCLHESLLPKQALQADEAVISVGVAKMLNIGVGDTVTVTVKGVPTTYTVSELQPITTTLLLLPPQSTDVNDPVCIRFCDTATDAQIAEVYALLETNGVITTSPDKLIGTLPYTVAGFLNLLNGAMLASLAVSAAGIANLLAGQYRARAKEREMLAVCGMKKRHIKLTYALELSILLLFAAALALVSTALFCTIINRVLGANGMVLFV